ncbi:HIT domain-containing protein [bacterium]|nr:HIT domain-containing protein [bacterium]
MDHLWAPWRMDFIKGEGPTGCIFCTLPAQGKDRESLIVHRGKQAYIILNKFPYNNGHLMIVPTLHVADYLAVPDAVLTEMNALTKLATRALNEKLKPHGFNIGMNLGAAAGAGVKEHLHVHVLPRWNGDTNFLPVLADTKCMPQHLLESYDGLQPWFASNA